MVGEVIVTLEGTTRKKKGWILNVIGAITGLQIQMLLYLSLGVATEIFYSMIIATVVTSEI